MICVFFDNSVAFKEWQVSREDSGTKLIHFLQLKLGSTYSSKALKRAIENNACLVNGRAEHFASSLVGYGDQIKFQDELSDQKKAPNKKIFIKILFEDVDFLMIEKPAGISSEDPRLLDKLKSDLGRSHLCLAHRLDKDTTGVLAFTKSARGKESLYNLFKDRKVFKCYFAIVDGVPANSKGIIENYLGKIATYQGQSLWGPVAKEKGVQAITEWKIFKKGKGIALLKCYPQTGRTHQIRVHLAGMGHPILGDKQYGKEVRSSYRPKRCLLHAFSLAFKHPFTNEMINVESPLPVDFSECNFEI